MQTTLGVSFCVLLLVGVGACSSEATKKDGDGGNGSVISGGTATNTGGASGSGGTPSSSAGSTTVPTGGMSNTSGSGAGGTVGSADCPALSCVDEKTITGCDPDTLMKVTKDCDELISSLGPGLTSDGCSVIDGRSVCGYDFEDTACRDGAPGFTFCFNDANGSDVDPLSFYFDCFTKEQYNLAAEGEPDFLVDAHTLIPCFSAYVMNNTIDCEVAAKACFPADPAEGAGGAGP
jgi:hypothetical protein